MPDLIPCTTPSPKPFSPRGGTVEICALIEREARSLVRQCRYPERARRRSRGWRAKVNRSKSYLDELGKVYVASLKELARNASMPSAAPVRLRLDALKDEIRAPLTAWEDAIRARQERFQEQLDAIAAQALDLGGLTIGDLLARIEAVGNIEIDEEWEEYIHEAQGIKDKTAMVLLHALEAAQRHARLLLVQEEAARARRQAHEEHIRQEAAAAAPAATLAEVAQQPTPAMRAAPAAPPPVRDDRALVHRAILADLEDLGIPTALGKRLISAIARGQVFHLSITY